jgi:N,N-dimethylformamidase beta subunit-like, C-terminal/PKD domain/HYDIN/CFA65/VesB-like, Ig-like domain/Cep192 domain 4
MDSVTYIHRIAPPKSTALPLLTFLSWGICLASMFFSPSALLAQNAIQIENAKQGTSSWEATNLADVDEGSTGIYRTAIEGYASLTSVNRGGQITFYVNVSTPGHNFNMKIYRMGWYGGLGGRLVKNLGTLTGVQQTMPTPDPTTGLIECNWTLASTLTLDSNTDPTSNWVSGIYTVLLTDTTSGLQRYIVFVVRDDARNSNYFFQSAVNTYQAYNNWGGKSLYAFNSDSGGPATKVSFNRPYLHSYGYDGSGDFLAGWEYDAVRFLEREGYDVTYGTDVDAHENASLLLSHKAILIFGHSEYWSKEMRTNIVAARDANVSLGIFAANVCYWQVRFEASALDSAVDRTMVGYKDYSTAGTSPGPDPYYTACQGGDSASCDLVTVQWRQAPVNLPENAFLGVMYVNDPVDGDIVITNASDPIFNTTGLQNNDILTGLLGYEVDAIVVNGQTPAGIVTLAESPYITTDSKMASGVSDMTIYTAGSGATVFAAGTFQFSWGLDNYSTINDTPPKNVASPGLQQMTRNLLAKFIGDQPPLASVGGPYSGATHQSIQFDGTATSDPDGTVSTYQWDYGDGSTGTGSYPMHSYASSGTYTVSLIVTDSEGSRNAATTTATITNKPIAALSPASLSFGNQLSGTSSTSKPVTLSNTGAAALTVTSIVPTGDYSQTNNCPASLGAGNSCIINVTFTPSTTGARAGTISVTDNNLSIAGSTQTVTLSGTGTAPVASVLPASLSFKNQLVSTPSATRTSMLKNTGTAPLTIASIVPSGDYSQTNNCGSSVAVGSSCTITVTFTPSTTGSRPGAITITDNHNGVNNSTQTVTLSGMGTLAVAVIQPASLNFGIQLVGASPPSKAVVITNNGTVPVNFTSFAASGDFAVMGSGTTCSTGSSLPAAASCNIAVTFTPTGAGPRKSSLVINDNAASGPHVVILTGVSTAAKLTPASLAFPDQTTGTPSTSQLITLKNVGASAINIWQTAILGANASDFSKTSTCGSTLGAGSSCTFSVTFTPGAAGPRAASFLVSDSGGGSPQGVPLGGSGVAPSAPVSSPTSTGSNTSTTISPGSPPTTPGDSASADAAFTRTKPKSSSPGQARRVKPVVASNGLSASSISFGRQRVGTPGVPKSVVLTNHGDATIIIREIKLFGCGLEDFSMKNDCGSDLAAGKSCTLHVTFKPHQSGVQKAEVNIEDGTEEGSRRVQLEGVGVQK